MPVRLDRLPPLAQRPARPRLWLWLALLPLFLLAGVGQVLLFGESAASQQADVWVAALGTPLALWGVLSFVRALLFFGQHRTADGWDAAREANWLRCVRRGRRSQLVLAVSLHTALRDPEDRSGRAQVDALLSGTAALKAQSSRQGMPAIRHSRLAYDAETPEELLQEALVRVLADLAPPLMQVSAKTPLALLLEIETSVSDDEVQRVWQQAWDASGIRQPVVPVEGHGLAALDQWLDQRITDPALLLVVASQMAPSQPQDTAEAAVGLLLGNRLTHSSLPPMACLHRPEQERKPTIEALLAATRQALDWASLEATSIGQVWRAGIDARRNAAVSTVLNDLAMPANLQQGLCHLDALLGQPGKASPWLAIAAATQTAERGAGPQFIFSGDSSAEAGLWGTVLLPVSTLSE